LLIISYKIRSLEKETPFWSAFGLWFTFIPVLARRRQNDEAEDHGEWTRFPITENEEVFVLVARRRPESSRWTIPKEDTDLLSGVGTWGTSSSKADDTFETLLLMSMNLQGEGI